MNSVLSGFSLSLLSSHEIYVTGMRYDFLTCFTPQFLISMSSDNSPNIELSILSHMKLLPQCEALLARRWLKT